MKTAPALALVVQYASVRPCPDRAQLRRWVHAALEADWRGERIGRRDARLVVRFIDRPEGRALNRRFRGRNYPTNVLTFAYDEGPERCADIVLCAPVAEAEARAGRQHLRDHYAHLVVHGVLHALGYDHQSARQASRMERLEVTILARFGVPDPYA